MSTPVRLVTRAGFVLALAGMLLTDPVVAKAIENGTVLDHHTIVHHTGDEYNVVIVNVFESWEAMDAGNGFGAAFEELEPDADRRAEVNAGYAWVFNDTEHKDNIYRGMETP